MVAVTLKSAKARLNELVNRALEGEDIVLMKGSRHVAQIMPISDADIAIAPRLTNAEAKRFIDNIERQRAEGRTRVFSSAEEAVEHLRRDFEKPSPRKRRNGK